MKGLRVEETLLTVKSVPQNVCTKESTIVIPVLSKVSYTHPY